MVSNMVMIPLGYILGQTNTAHIFVRIVTITNCTLYNLTSISTHINHHTPMMIFNSTDTFRIYQSDICETYCEIFIRQPLKVSESIYTLYSEDDGLLEVIVWTQLTIGGLWKL
jgi:hypothetical protein